MCLILTQLLPRNPDLAQKATFIILLISIVPITEMKILDSPTIQAFPAP